MNDKEKQNLMEDAEDEGLKAVMGSKFQDQTKEDRKDVPKAAEDLRKYPPHLGTVADHRPAESSKVLDGRWTQLNTVSPMAKLKGCAKGVWLYGCISLLLFWWQQAGLLDSKAAVPSFIVLALLAGVQIGSICRE